jgi:pyrroline-5-carboxylate reductase
VAGEKTGESEMKLAHEVFSALGRALVIPESKADAMTGIAGCGPAFVFQILEGLMDAGIRNGLAAREALEMAAQTLVGASKMVLVTGKHPAELRNQVTTPGGATIEGVVAIEKGRVRAALIEAVSVSTKRAKELGGSAPLKPTRTKRSRSASTPKRRSAPSAGRARRRPKRAS